VPHALACRNASGLDGSFLLLVSCGRCRLLLRATTPTLIAHKTGDARCQTQHQGAAPPNAEPRLPKSREITRNARVYTAATFHPPTKEISHYSSLQHGLFVHSWPSSWTVSPVP
jgi:hypothetical protein